ncbi:MAG: hypothetical protein D3X82_16815 [Candidatus Leucobacter sulfamidivorax]|nr:hypothetical protein [Candidatus Leucobacter sulfamidivorax]
MTEEEEFYTYKGAARRADRSISTIMRWAREWAAAGELHTDAEGRRIVAHSTLMRTLAAKLETNTAHQRKLARILREHAAGAPADPT